MNSLLLPESITSQDDTRELVRWCIKTIGLGYHPDTPAGDYVTDDGRVLFLEADCNRIDRLHEEAFQRGHGELIYSYGLELQRDALGLPSVKNAEVGE